MKLCMETDYKHTYIFCMKYVHISMKKKKMYPLLNEAPWHEDILGNGGIALHILNLSTRWGQCSHTY
jgi:hypothetical protein